MIPPSFLLSRLLLLGSAGGGQPPPQPGVPATTGGSLGASFGHTALVAQQSAVEG
jgi:hypothetical protein